MTSVLRLSWLAKAPFRGLFAFWLGCLALPVAAEGDRPPGAAIASAHPLATEAGFEILAAGGNAFDAAVAVSAALAVVEPYGSGLGGGGFWLLHRASDGKQVMIDGRETAPDAAHRDMYLDETGEVLAKASIDGPLAAGIPGEPAALAHIAEQYGRLPLARSLAPAMRLAGDGFPVDEQYRRMAGWRLPVLAGNPGAARQFLVDGQVPVLGYRLKQPDLAKTLIKLARLGRDGFYQGEVALKLVEGARAAGGIWTLRDLAEYQVKEREPIYGHYQGWRLVSAALPSSGGILLAQMFNMLSGYPQDKLNPIERQHYRIEVMRRAYQDRARYLGDTDFVEVPVGRLLHPEYALGRGSNIHLDRATSSRELGALDDDSEGEGRDTSHFSIIDAEGNRVAATLSVNYPFGSGFVPPGTGVLLNDEMDDFSAKPGVPNVYGLVGAEANAIAPGKRMLSSMSPTFLEGPDGIAILGTPGGSRIITMVLQAALRLIEDGETDPVVWVSAPRLHHQFLPDRVELETAGLDPEIRQGFSALGHELKLNEGGWGNMQAIYWDKRTGELRAASDPRGIGKAEVKRSIASDRPSRGAE